MERQTHPPAISLLPPELLGFGDSLCAWAAEKDELVAAGGG